MQAYASLSPTNGTSHADLQINPTFSSFSPSFLSLHLPSEISGFIGLLLSVATPILPRARSGHHLRG